MAEILIRRKSKARNPKPAGKSSPEKSPGRTWPLGGGRRIAPARRRRECVAGEFSGEKGGDFPGRIVAAPGREGEERRFKRESEGTLALNYGSDLLGRHWCLGLSSWCLGRHWCLGLPMFESTKAKLI